MKIGMIYITLFSFREIIEYVYVFLENIGLVLDR